MTEPVRCSECNGRGWKIATRRGHVAASRLGLATSVRQDCLYCEGAGVPAERFEWEVFVGAKGGEALEASGTSPFQATAMDALRTAMRDLPANAWGQIRHQVYDVGAVADDHSSRIIFRAFLDAAGSVRFERVTA
ncbi:hypothetical protein [Nonomuraea sp. NPDC003804]|uniref:hypothetical protein n=1 Tax=Nonomuraea sp. NPDC003804 TaxID=3154547 RepID=UPI0033B7615C